MARGCAGHFYWCLVCGDSGDLLPGLLNNYCSGGRSQSKVAPLMPDNQEPSDFARGLRLEYPSAERIAALRLPRAERSAEATTAPKVEGATEEHNVPAVVLLIGLYEFIRAIVLSVVYALALHNPGAYAGSHTFWTLFFVLSNGAARVTAFLPVTILYALGIGTCLWLRVNWGRRTLIATSGWAVFRLVRYLLLFSAIESAGMPEQVASIAFLKDAAYMLTAVNVVIGLYLAFAPGIAEAFGQEK
jgi:hypothetical protein